MKLESYVNAHGDSFNFSRQQASDFAKQVADDFNPIHDIDAKRFCVPGDLLFAVALSKRGLHQHMQVAFADMVSDGTQLKFQQEDDGTTAIKDDKEKTYLSIESSGDTSNDQEQIRRLTEQYVAFSGTTFPHVLVPLWKEQGVMVNPARPLVIYQSMTINLDTLDFQAPELELSNSTFEVNGKRGNVRLQFRFKENGQVLGEGEKRMVLSGLKEYDQAAIDDLVEYYNNRKQQLG